jgi:hypothetical protein
MFYFYSVNIYCRTQIKFHFKPNNFIICLKRNSSVDWRVLTMMYLLYCQLFITSQGSAVLNHYFNCGYNYISLFIPVLKVMKSISNAATDSVSDASIVLAHSWDLLALFLHRWREELCSFWPLINSLLPVTTEALG